MTRCRPTPACPWQPFAEWTPFLLLPAPPLSPDEQQSQIANGYHKELLQSKRLSRLGGNMQSLPCDPESILELWWANTPCRTESGKVRA